MSKSYDIVMESRKELVNKLIKNMEKENSIWSKNWNSSALYPQNPVSKVRYLGGNRVRLMAQAIDKEYKDSRWVTFKQASENDWKIKKGEKGTLCEKWIFTKKEKEIDENGKEVKREIKLDKPVVNYFYVFNGEQIENIPELKIKDYPKDIINEITQDFINSSECRIKEVAQDRAYYNPEADEIVLPLREAFKSQEDFLATTFHEMVHSTGHKDRLNRDLSDNFGTEGYAKEELVAELGSVFLQSKLGIKLEGKHFDNHSAYLKSWINILKNDPNELFRAAVQAEKASERLHERYIENEQEQLREFSQKEFRPHPLDAFSVEFHYAEIGKDTNNLNFEEEERKYREIQAYEFIEKVIKFDKEYSSKREIAEDMGYYKSWMTINLKGYSTGKIRIDLGDKEFGGFEKVSDALEYRLKSFPNELIKYKNSYAENFGTTPEAIEKDAKEILEKIEKSIGYFKEKEQMYLNERENKIENKKEEINISEKIKKEINENPNISKDELTEKLKLNDKELNEELGRLIKNKELFYSNNKGEIRYYTEKSEYIKGIQEQERQKELAKEERKKELEKLIKETVEKDIPKDNYNALTGNRVIVENHSSGEKRWLAVSDVKDKNISIKENQTPTLTITLDKTEERLYAKPIEYYNVSQLNITKEIEQKFVSMKEKEKVVEKEKDKGIER